MASAINYTKAAKVAVIAVAIDLYWNRGQTISAFALWILGSLALEYGSDAINTQKSAYYRIIRHQDYSFPRDRKALATALERIQKDYPDECARYLKHYKISTQEEALDFFMKDLSEGCCSGVAHAIFDKIHRKESSSIKESVPVLKYEDIFYHQIMHTLYIAHLAFSEMIEEEVASRLAAKKIDEKQRLVDECQRLIDKMKQLKDDELHQYIESGVEPQECKDKLDQYYSFPTFSFPTLSERTEEEWKIEEQKIRDQIKTENLLIGKHHQTPFQESEKFPSKASPKTYQFFLEKAMSKFAEENDFVGIVHIPGHVMGFQYGPSGYFLYDSRNTDKGLFAYPDSKIFFQELRKHVLDDASYSTEWGLKRDKPNANQSEIRKEAQELLNKVQLHFAVRPLNDINPST